jgi:hypothetical protein
MSAIIPSSPSDAEAPYFYRHAVGCGLCRVHPGKRLLSSVDDSESGLRRECGRKAGQLDPGAGRRRSSLVRYRLTDQRPEDLPERSVGTAAETARRILDGLSIPPGLGWALARTIHQVLT